MACSQPSKWTRVRGCSADFQFSAWATRHYKTASEHFTAVSLESLRHICFTTQDSLSLAPAAAAQKVVGPSVLAIKWTFDHFNIFQYISIYFNIFQHISIYFNSDGLWMSVVLVCAPLCVWQRHHFDARLKLTTQVWQCLEDRSGGSPGIWYPQWLGVPN